MKARIRGGCTDGYNRMGSLAGTSCALEGLRKFLSEIHARVQAVVLQVTSYT
jgi:hypothetical protein